MIIKQQVDPLYATVRQMEMYEPPKKLEDLMQVTEDGKKSPDLVAMVSNEQKDNRSAYENPIPHLQRGEYWRVLTDFVDGVHNDLPVEAKEVLGLVRTAYNALYTFFRDTVLRTKEYRANAKDGWALCGSG